MNKSPLRLVLSLGTLLGAALLLPQGASAHDMETHQRGDRNYHQPDHMQLPQRHYRNGDLSEWHLLRHRERHHNGYRAQQRHTRMKGNQQGPRHHHRHHYHVERHQEERVQRHTQPLTPPVQLELSYHIVL